MKYPLPLRLFIAALCFLAILPLAPAARAEALGQEAAALDAANLTGGEAAEPSPAPTPASGLKKGDEGEAVEALQKRLKELGLLSGAEDGAFGSATEKAVMAFQNYCVSRKGSAVAVDGTVDEALLALIYDEDYTDGLFDLEKGDRGERVQEMQERLYVEGFLTGSFDGYFGKETENALKSFQELLLERGVDGVKVSGVADSVTRNCLFDDSFQTWEGSPRAGDGGSLVLRLQNRLVGLGYLNAADGNYGQKTAEAVARFQKGAKLGETGVADGETLSLLFSEGAQESDAVILKDLAKGAKGAGVRKLQEALKRYGFLTANADGSYGKATVAAVESLQKLLAEQGRKTAVDGKASVALQELFYAEDFSAYGRDLQLGDEGEAVARAARRLEELRCGDAPAGDLFDAYMDSAVKLFQKTNGLPVTGVIDRACADAMYRADAIPAAHAVRRDLSYGDDGVTVLEMQERLQIYGFYGGVPSGKFDRETRTALGDFITHTISLLDQAPDWARALTDDEKAAASFQEALLTEKLPAFIEELADGAKGGQVLRVQKRLASLYYMGSKACDGKAGKTTQSAIAAFQREMGLEETGVADSLTQSLLFSDAARARNVRYLLKVDLSAQRVYAFERNEAGGYDLVREMICSTGITDGSTPRGIFVNTWPQERWHYFKKFYCWAQYTSVIYLEGDILFHSVLYSSKSESSLTRSSLNNLGHRASHGCVRLSVADAKWVYENCEKGTPVLIY